MGPLGFSICILICHVNYNLFITKKLLFSVVPSRSTVWWVGERPSSTVHE